MDVNGKCCTVCSVGTSTSAVRPSVINVGSRCSQLALRQTEIVINKLKTLHPNLGFNVIKMTTKGDQILDKALSKIGGKSLFTKELEVALYEHKVDFVVHSLKDLPTTLPPGLVIGAVLKRDDPRDCLILHKKHSNVKRLSDLPEGVVIGTSSLRRISQISRHYPTLKFENIRGNLNTRLKKLDDDKKYDGIVLAVAGIDRLGWQSRISIYLEKHDMLYAVSQGAMAVECRNDDINTLKLLSAINDTETAIRITGERTFMKKLDGGCSVPIGTWSSLEDEKIVLSGAVFSSNGSEMIFCEREDLLNISPKTSYSDTKSPIFSDQVLNTSKKKVISNGKGLINGNGILKDNREIHINSNGTPKTNGTQNGNESANQSPEFSSHEINDLSRELIDIVHQQFPSQTVHVVKELMENNLIIHKSGVCCTIKHVSKFDVAQKCGALLATSLISRGAKVLLDKVRAEGLQEINKAPSRENQSNGPPRKKSKES